MKNPSILIFDEATSQLDYESERIIQQNMERIARGRTVIIIAHRLSTVRRCHRILTIERGRLVEDGSHDELIPTGGRYASLHRLGGAVAPRIERAIAIFPVFSRPAGKFLGRRGATARADLAAFPPLIASPARLTVSPRLGRARQMRVPRRC